MKGIKMGFFRNNLMILISNRSTISYYADLLVMSDFFSSLSILTSAWDIAVNLSFNYVAL